MKPATHRAITFTARERAELLEVADEPTLGAGEISGPTLFSLVSPGTELAGTCRRLQGQRELAARLVRGRAHFLAAHRVALGAGVELVEACQGFLRVPAEHLQGRQIQQRVVLPPEDQGRLKLGSGSVIELMR